MLSILPFFIIVGFGLGFESRRSFVDVIATPLRRRLCYFLLFLFLVIGLPSIHAATLDLSARGDLLLFSGAGIGLAAGYWFAAHDDGRDRLILVSAAAILLFLSALDYDIKLFDRLTSFGAAGVSLALSNHQSSSDSDSGSQLQLTKDQGGPFRGATRLDFALLRLGSLGEDMLKDEQYAHAFVGDTIPRDGKAFLNFMDHPALALALLNCTKAQNASEIFLELQSKFRSESPSSPVVQESVFQIARSFYDNKQSLKIGLESLDAALGSLLDIANMQRERILRGEETVLKPKLCGLIAEQGISATIASFKAEPGFQASIDPAQASVDPASAKPYFYLAYHGIIVALAQYALGNREGAIQFLDRLIMQQQSALEAAQKAVITGSTCAGEGDSCAAAARLEVSRRRVTVARIENVQDGLMDTWGDHSIDPERLATLAAMSETFGAALETVRPDDAVGPALFRHDPRAWARCDDKLPADPLAQSLISQWAFVRMIAIATTLDVAGADANLLRMDAALGGKLDLLADYTENFDADCLPRFGYAGATAAAPAQLLRAAGDYWSARAAAYRDVSDETQIGPAIAALCRALADYRKAEQLAPDEDTSANPNSTRLDKASVRDDALRLPIRLSSSAKRSSDLLESHYSAGQLDKFCRQ